MKKYSGELILMLVALLFGSSYMFQTHASLYMGAFSFGTCRYFLAFLLLLPLAIKNNKTSLKELLKISLSMGMFLFIASAFQQTAAGKTESGKLGFITSLYIVLVPLINRVIYKKKVSKSVLLSIILALIGLLFLCNVTSFDINPYDFLVLVTAFAYAVEIIYINQKGTDINPITFMCAAFFGTSLFFGVATLVLKDFNLIAIKKSFIDIIYVGMFSGAIAYCLQVVGQRKVDDSRASLIMSLESVISVLMGFIFLKEVLSIKELIGCLIMFIAILICVKSNKN